MINSSEITKFTIHKKNPSITAIDPEYAYMDTDTLMFIENIQINFDYTKRIHDPVNCLNWILILPRDATYNSATERRYDPAPTSLPDIACGNIRFSSLYAAW